VVSAGVVTSGCAVVDAESVVPVTSGIKNPSGKQLQSNSVKRINSIDNFFMVFPPKWVNWTNILTFVNFILSYLSTLVKSFIKFNLLKDIEIRAPA
jgi:hypothetical protein